MCGDVWADRRTSGWKDVLTGGRVDGWVLSPIQAQHSPSAEKSKVTLEKEARNQSCEAAGNGPWEPCACLVGRR